LNKKNNKLDYHFIFTSYNYDLLLTLAKFSWVQTNVFSSCCVKPLAEYSLVLAEQVSSLLKNMTLNDENILLYSCFIMEKISNLLFL
jgi:arginyl-tRNA synthetase